MLMFLLKNYFNLIGLLQLKIFLPVIIHKFPHIEKITHKKIKRKKKPAPDYAEKLNKWCSLAYFLSRT